MAITFSCGHCGKSLTTTDDKAGRQAKCPGCGEVITVPGPEAVEADAVLEEGGQEDETGDLPQAPVPRRKKAVGTSAGTKTCPMCGAENPRRARKCQACGEALEGEEDDEPRSRGTTLEPGDVISASWTIYKKEMGIVLGSVIIAMLASSMASAPAQVISSFADAQQRQGQNPPPVLALIGILLLIPSYLVSWFLQVGVTKVLFKVARGKEASIGEIFSGGHYFLRMTGATILFALMIFAGMLACVVPGILVLLMFWPYVFLLVDDDPDGIDCLWRSKDITKGNWGSVFVLFLAAFGINLLGLMACCVGVIFTAPLTQLLFAVAYCRMTGQRTAE